MLYRLRRQPEIGFTQQQGFDDFRRVLRRELTDRTWKSLAPGAQRLWQQRLSQRRRADQAQCALLAPAEAVCKPPQILQVDGQAFGLLLQHPRLGGGLQLAAHPVEQRKAKLLLGMLENLARRRLGDMQQLGRGRKAAGLQDRLEQFDMTQPHACPSFSRSSITAGYGSAPSFHWPPRWPAA